MTAVFRRKRRFVGWVPRYSSIFDGAVRIVLWPRRPQPDSVHGRPRYLTNITDFHRPSSNMRFGCLSFHAEFPRSRLALPPAPPAPCPRGSIGTPPHAPLRLRPMIPSNARVHSYGLPGQAASNQSQGGGKIGRRSRASFGCRRPLQFLIPSGAVYGSASKANSLINHET